jgi:hypothetical protein
MKKHKDFITTVKNVCSNWKSDTECPIKDWSQEAIVIVRWPNHVNFPIFNGDCDLYGPYTSTAEAVKEADDEHEIDARI